MRRQHFRVYHEASQRWAGIGPYYAMFPVPFADAVVKRFTDVDDVVLDPFAGRGTSIFSAACKGRIGFGVELNPVGWVYANSKLNPPTLVSVAERLEEIAALSIDFKWDALGLPEFFRSCFSFRIRGFLLAARAHLDWRESKVDCTTMALILVYLHGKQGAALSNQMMQTKSMSPAYAVRWWRQRNLKPLDLDPVGFLLQRLEWRYAKGRPSPTVSRVFLGDSVDALPLVERQIKRRRLRGARLLFTSPPYLRLANYHYDQWLRLWMLGGEPSSNRVGGVHKGKFEHPARYRELLVNVFGNASELLTRDAVVYVRTGRRDETFNTTVEVLTEVFPRKTWTVKDQPFRGQTQTSLFGDQSLKAGEVDLILQPN